ncbi:secretion protein HlyD [Pseudomonas syringae pv. actinidiae ICMP 19070]|nr:secretion protein HlyD [Pseudomonas syringae pv. actinidiae ICMP 19070]
MKKPILTLGRVVLTLLVVTLAAVVVWRMVMYYMYAPWTRDGHIRADIVQIAPDVSGLIQKVEVTDNQPVHKGQVLFTIDQDRFRLALRQAARTSVTVAWATWWRVSNWKKASLAKPAPSRHWVNPAWPWMPRS